MSKENRHPTDAELLLAADGELAPRRATEVKAHLHDCKECRAWLDRIEKTTAALADAYRGAQHRPLASASGARAALQSRLATTPDGSRRAFWLSQFVEAFRAPVWAYAIGIVLVGGVWLAFHYQAVRSGSTYELARDDVAGPLMPNAALTPGAVGAVTASDVCAAAGPAERRPPTSMQQAVFHEYGMDGAPAQGYEVDHLITPALGGTDDIRNLWPESYSSKWNAHVKDDLEDHLHDLVCEGKLDLGTAQRDMATNWISAYKKYFHTDKPLLHTSDLIADRNASPRSWLN